MLVAPKSAFMPANRYTCNAATSYINTKCDKDRKGFNRVAKTSNLKSCYFSYRNQLYIDVYVSDATNLALMPKSSYAYNAASSYINTYSKFV